MADTPSNTSSGVTKLTRVPARTATKVKLRLLDCDGNPMGNVKCELDWDGTTIPDSKAPDLKTDADGLLEVAVPALKTRAFLVIYPFAGDANETITMQLFLTDFGPPAQTSGTRARLSNLGYEVVKVTDETNPLASLTAAVDVPTQRAIQRFQFANGLVDATQKPSGTVDAATAARLLSAHDTTDPLIKLPSDT
jgi:hypothetical protein